MRLKKTPPGRGKDWQQNARGGITREEQEARAAQIRLRVMALAASGERKPNEAAPPTVVSGVGSGVTSPLETPLRWYRQGRTDDALSIGTASRSRTPSTPA